MKNINLSIMQAQQPLTKDMILISTSKGQFTGNNYQAVIFEIVNRCQLAKTAIAEINIVNAVIDGKIANNREMGSIMDDLFEAEQEKSQEEDEDNDESFFNPWEEFGIDKENYYGCN